MKKSWRLKTRSTGAEVHGVQRNKQLDMPQSMQWMLLNASRWWTRKQR